MPLCVCRICQRSKPHGCIHAARGGTPDDEGLLLLLLLLLCRLQLVPLGGWRGQAVCHTAARSNALKALRGSARLRQDGGGGGGGAAARSPTSRSSTRSSCCRRFDDFDNFNKICVLPCILLLL